MRALILVDLDNVLKDRTLEELEEYARVRLTKLRKRFTECVTSYAFNTVTANDVGLSWDSLDATARGLADALEAERSSVEIALALPMPQTADVLLGRLASAAPTDEATGRYELSVLVTKDKDLERVLGDEVFARGKSRWARVLHDRPISAWAPGPGAAPFIRKGPTPPRARGSEPLVWSGAYTELVSQPAHAGWASGRHVDLEPGISLGELGLRLEEDPWLLSQIGATRVSLRGLARLARRGDLLGAVCAKDGLELRGDALRPTEVSSCVAASVGIGAARFPNERATVASRLPISVLHAAGSSPSDRRGVRVRQTLQQIPVGDPVGGDALSVQLRRAGNGHLVAKVKHGREHQPGGWWLVGDTRVTSEQRLDHGGRRLPHPMWTTGAPFRTDGTSAARLALRCPLAAGAHVRCESPIAQGTIGQAWMDRPHGKLWPIAVYAHRPVPSIDAIAVEPIHEDDRAPAELRHLPIMVAR